MSGNKMNDENKHDEETPFLPPISPSSQSAVRRGTVATNDMGTFDKSHDAMSIGDISSKNEDRESDIGICWFHPPEDALDFEWLFSIRGAENMYLYFWLLKDLSWAQDWYYPAYTFGALAIAWSFIMVCNALYDGATNEVFTSTAMFLWLFANFWWMTGDIHDYVLNYPNDDYNDWYDTNPLSKYLSIRILIPSHVPFPLYPLPATPSPSPYNSYQYPLFLSDRYDTSSHSNSNTLSCPFPYTTYPLYHLPPTLFAFSL